MIKFVEKGSCILVIVDGKYIGEICEVAGYKFYQVGKKSGKRIFNNVDDCKKSLCLKYK